MEVDRLMQLYSSAGAFPVKGTRRKIKDMIGKVIGQKEGVNIRRKTTVSLRYDSEVRKREVRAVMEKQIFETELHRTIKSALVRKTRLVWSRNRSVASILCNHREAAKLGVGDRTCAGYDLNRLDGHVHTRITEVLGINMQICNGKNITKPAKRTGKTELRARVFASLKATLGVRLGIEEQELQVEGCIAERTGNSGAVEEDEVKQLKWKFRQLVITQVDKNPGELVLMCPSTYQHALKKMFVYNSAYVLAKCANHYSGEDAIRDLAKWRPIAPVNTEPTKTGSRRVARALNALLVRLPVVEHFNMGVTTQLKENLKRIEKEQGCKRESAMMILCSYDIKEMFTSLPHGAIVDAVEWLPREWEKKGRSRVSVSRRAREVIFNHKSLGSSYVLLTSKTIRKFVKFELAHTYTKCTGTLLKQIVGIPMGKNSSPPLACILCAKYKTEFVGSLGKDRALFHSIRFMDDVETGVLVDRWNEESFHRAEEIMKAFETSYGEKLILVRTDEGDNTIDFIGAKVPVAAGPVRFLVAPQMKNQD
ncbi:hypothetical protein CBR_g23608 [Chara braunii]|uniref:Reverse transcriptase domain-containing protein n=1 Tax=Chara braunii TaxID=69332 RepID=A0A388L4N4_CHABU|nr:hypothetical protein CBR_g23608 [Chara braunii]|eukprot:GBG77279.1 hypothetical protein CBR_g23608 [Chara braunii]